MCLLGCLACTSTTCAMMSMALQFTFNATSYDKASNVQASLYYRSQLFSNCEPCVLSFDIFMK